MNLIDVNILVYAHRPEAENHEFYKGYLDNLLGTNYTIAYSPLVLSGFLRIVTHPKVFKVPTPLARALEFTELFTASPLAFPLNPGPNHWKIFANIAKEQMARGNRLPDCYLGAIALEHGCGIVTNDRFFAGIDGLHCVFPKP
jgi:uncharacterized protein